MILALTIGVLLAGGTYLLVQREMLRVVFGLALISHGVNLLLLATGVGAWRAEPLLGRTDAADAADPLPQAFVLTAIVISLAVTIFMCALAVIGRDDDTTTVPATGDRAEGHRAAEDRTAADRTDRGTES
ncbi:sodium:proton antiporter [Dietzia sp.]|uniref:sodium:proton antiporter n=1 Tax=Dietzia sp. TaxID=1871616 RepID=UPI002FD91600